MLSLYILYPTWKLIYNLFARLGQPVPRWQWIPAPLPAEQNRQRPDPLLHPQPVRQLHRRDHKRGESPQRRLERCACSRGPFHRTHQLLLYIRQTLQSTAEAPGQVRHRQSAYLRQQEIQDKKDSQQHRQRSQFHRVPIPQSQIPLLQV